MTDTDMDFKLAVETAALRAWPGVERQMVMGWQARFAGGHTKRANSASPWPPLCNIAEHVEACEAVYADHGQPCIIKVPDFIDPAVDALLKARGYTLADPTLVMLKSLECVDPAQAISGMTLGSWLPAWAACNGKAALPPAHRLILEARLHDAIYACLPDQDEHVHGGHVSCGLGVHDSDLFGIFDICTRRDVRRQGHGSRLMHGLLAAGKCAGASACYLQVVADNGPARALYDSLGFTELYTYWYRVQPAA